MNYYSGEDFKTLASLAQAVNPKTATIESREAALGVLSFIKPKKSVKAVIKPSSESDPAILAAPFNRKKSEKAWRKVAMKKFNPFLLRT